MNAPCYEIPGFEIRVESRRFYGATCYTWIEARREGETDWRSLGDPWPVMHPSRAEIRANVTALFSTANP